MIDTKFKADLRSIEKFRRAYPEITSKVIQSKLEESAEYLEEAIRKRTPQFTDTLRTSILSHKVVFGEQIRVSTDLKYGLPVELGSKPHWPPQDALQMWVERKLGKSGSEARAVTFMIAWAIAGHPDIRRTSKKGKSYTISKKSGKSKGGTKGHYMFRDGYKAAKPAINRILAEIPDEIVRQVEAMG